jgi:hypothetical protein
MNLCEFLKLTEYEKGYEDGLYYWDNIVSVHIPKGYYIQGDIIKDLDIKYDKALELSPEAQYQRAKDSNCGKAFVGFVCKCEEGNPSIVARIITE